MRALYDYDYPGNVRELRNIIERAFVLCSDNLIDVKHLPAEVIDASSLRADGKLKPSERRIAEAHAHQEIHGHDSPQAQRLLAVLNAHNWNRASAAESMGISRTTLWRRMKEYGLV
jgi:transcriptional regulator of acetoin/glycerol metabolism